MKTVTLTKNTENTGSFFISDDGDILDTYGDAALTGRVVAEVVVDSMFVGTLDEQRRAALVGYCEAEGIPLSSFM